MARAFDDGLTLEVNRTCTDGAKNANSMLYGAVWRAAKAMGYKRCITYTQADESGVSLRAAGFRRVRDIEPRKSWAESSVKLRGKPRPCRQRRRSADTLGDYGMTAQQQLAESVPSRIERALESSGWVELPIPDGTGKRRRH